nr:EOG090X0EO1 [Artemia franciscana]
MVSNFKDLNHENQITREIASLQLAILSIGCAEGYQDEYLNNCRNARRKLKHVKDLITEFKELFPDEEMIASSFHDLYISSQNAYRKACRMALDQMDVNARVSLLKPVSVSTGARRNKDHDDMLAESSRAFEQFQHRMSEIIRQRRCTNERLAQSSEVVVKTHDELRSLRHYVDVSRKLLTKYDRRETMDTFIFFLAFAFFLTCFTPVPLEVHRAKVRKPLIFPHVSCYVYVFPLWNVDTSGALFCHVHISHGACSLVFLGDGCFPVASGGVFSEVCDLSCGGFVQGIAIYVVVQQLRYLGGLCRYVIDVTGLDPLSLVELGSGVQCFGEFGAFGRARTMKIGLPPSTEEIRDGLKIVTEYMRNEDDAKVKVTRTYKIEKRQVPKSIARRKCLPKFGQSKGDKTGPNPATTIVAEEVFMQVSHQHSLDIHYRYENSYLAHEKLWYRALNLVPPRSYYNTIGGNAILFRLSNCSDLLDSDFLFPVSSR